MTRQPPAPGPGDREGAGGPVVPDAARAVLSRMRASARSVAQPRPAGSRAAGLRRRRSGGFSGARPDERDPMGLGTAWRALVEEQGWGADLRGASVIGLWPDIVGPVNAEHAVPESFDAETGRLAVRTSSTAWAEQMRLLLPVLHRAIEARVGPGVVREIRISGPTAPRVRGRLRVRGRGPRDTFG